MEINFSKYHGNGNDFVVIDNRSNTFPAGDNELVRRLCDRNFGIGGDGLMLMEKKDGYDFHMRYFNSDVREATMCGNGGRCMIHFAYRLGVVKHTVVFSGIDGRHEGSISGQKTVRLRMKDVTAIEQDGDAYIIDTGSPHYVVFTDDVDDMDVVARGREVRYSDKFSPGGINVNFVCVRKNGIHIRTYERGVENETLACGTGSVAAAICARLKSPLSDHTVKVYTSGGLLEVSFKTRSKSIFTDIWLTGPAQFVFEGTIDISNLIRL